MKYSNDPIVRSRYFSTLKQYRKLRKLKSRQFRQEIINQLDTLYDNTPKEYWKLLDRLKSKDLSNVENNDHISEKEWYEYFKQLNTELHDNPTMDSLLSQLESEKIFNELDYVINEDEIFKSLRQLKNKKQQSCWL